jgi:hypothetical protein
MSSTGRFPSSRSRQSGSQTRLFYVVGNLLHAFSAMECHVRQNLSQESYNGELPPDDLFGGNFFKNGIFAALPSLAGPQARCGPQKRLTRRLRLRSLYAPFAKPSLGHSACRKTEAQASCPRYGFANAGNVRRNAVFHAGLWSRRGKSKKQDTATPPEVSLIVLKRSRSRAEVGSLRTGSGGRSMFQ